MVEIVNVWGSIAEWVAAVAAVGALVAAVVAARHTAGLLQREAQRDENAADTEASAQARSIAAWAAIKVTSGTKNVGLILVNDSSVPVYDLEVTGTYRDREFAPLKLEVLPPGAVWVQQDFQNNFGWEYAVDRSSVAEEIRPLTVAYRWRISTVAFRDGAGVRWTREAAGGLRRS